MKLNKNRIFSICVFLFACIMIYLTSHLESMYSVSDRDVGPKLFPTMAAVVMIICAIGKFITEGNDTDPVFTKEGWKRIFMIFVIMALYLLSLQFLGFIIATPIFSAICVIAMKEDRKISPVGVIAFAVILTAVLYIVFEKLILITLPKGILLK